MDIQTHIVVIFLEKTFISPGYESTTELRPLGDISLEKIVGI